MGGEKLENTVLMEYMTQPPRKYTFEQPKLKKWLESYCNGKVLNLFAGKTKLNVDEVRVDLSDEFNPDFNMEAFDFVLYAKNNGIKFDTIILDPPYSLRKSMEKYNGKVCSTFNKIKDELPNILNDGGRIITFGYTSVCMGKQRGFEKECICLVCHGGSHHDTVCVVEKNIQHNHFKNYSSNNKQN